MPLTNANRVFIVMLIVSAFFALAWLVTLVGAGKLAWEVYGPVGWRFEVRDLAVLKGSRQALSDFRAGKLRLYVLDRESDDAYFTGRTDGEFEVWRADYYGDLGPAYKYSREQFVESYNRKMRYMAAHPEKFRSDGPQREHEKASNAVPNSTTVTNAQPL